jgi:hypothetical protein
VSLAVNRVPSVPFMGDGQPQRLFIGGQWGLAASGRTFETRNPSTGDLRANRHVRHGRAAAAEPKIIPVLATGRTLVLNPSEETPPPVCPHWTAARHLTGAGEERTDTLAFTAVPAFTRRSAEAAARPGRRSGPSRRGSRELAGRRSRQRNC